MVKGKWRTSASKTIGRQVTLLVDSPRNELVQRPRSGGLGMNQDVGGSKRIGDGEKELEKPAKKANLAADLRTFFRHDER